MVGVFVDIGSGSGVGIGIGSAIAGSDVDAGSVVGVDAGSVAERGAGSDVDIVGADVVGNCNVKSGVLVPKISISDSNIRKEIYDIYDT